MFFGENEGIKKSGKSIKGNPTFKMFYRTLMLLFNKLKLMALTSK